MPLPKVRRNSRNGCLLYTSSATQVEINIPFITANEQGPQHLNMTLTKAKFDELTRDLVERTAIPVQNALKDAGVSASELSKVLLVGGSTRIPAVQDKVKQLTGHEPSKKMNPDECVALGASIQGGKLAGDAEMCIRDRIKSIPAVSAALASPTVSPI